MVGTRLKYKDLLKIPADLDNLEMLYSFDVLLYNSLNDTELKDHIHRVDQELYLAEMKPSHTTRQESCGSGVLEVQ